MNDTDETEKIEKRVKEIIAQELHRDADTIKNRMLISSLMDEISWDFVARALEEEFGLPIADVEMDEVSIVQDVIDLITKPQPDDD
ncbi:hypothetical protein ABZX38_32140 [Streptomyces longwoodensis]|uniref:hypothetical protein n=1 Tax=Streptomyces longwoodensis TaxID=68231 RepID=UPI0033A8B42D